MGKEIGSIDGRKFINFNSSHKRGILFIILVMSRIAKQFLYGTFFLLVFGALVWGVYSITLKPAPSCFDNKQNGDEAGLDCGGPCISCDVKNLAPLFAGEANLYGVDRVYSASARIQNSNTDFGARTFSYTVNFYDAGGILLESVSGKSFIYANESKNIVEAGARIVNGIPVRAEMVIDNASVEWAKRGDFSEPKYELKDVVAELENGQAVISGAVLNPNNFTFSKVVISAFLADKFGTRAGASRTELNDVGQFRQESFKIFIPVRSDMLENIDLKATAESVAVSVLK